jgi:hypothetical protein
MIRNNTARERDSVWRHRHEVSILCCNTGMRSDEVGRSCCNVRKSRPEARRCRYGLSKHRDEVWAFRGEVERKRPKASGLHRGISRCRHALGSRLGVIVPPWPTPSRPRLKLLSRTPPLSRRVFRRHRPHLDPVDPQPDSSRKARASPGLGGRIDRVAEWPSRGALDFSACSAKAHLRPGRCPGLCQGGPSGLKK